LLVTNKVIKQEMYNCNLIIFFLNTTLVTRLRWLKSQHYYTCFQIKWQLASSVTDKNLTSQNKQKIRLGKKLVLQKSSGALIWPAIKWISVLCLNKTEQDYIQEINHPSFFFTYKYTYKRYIVEVIIFTNRQINKSEEKRLHLRLNVGKGAHWNKYLHATRSLAIYSANASKEKGIANPNWTRPA